MRTIITGGTGLIGTALTRALLEKDSEVILLSRNPTRHENKTPEGARLHFWDGKTAAGWGDLVTDQSRIINLAGANISAGRWTKRRKQVLLLSRTQAGEAVTQAVKAAQGKPEIVLQASAVGFYGSRGDEIITEQTTQGSDFISHLTGAWEESTAEVESLGVRRVIFRTGVVLSKNGGALPKMLLPFRLFVGGPIGRGNQWFPWIHIDDEIAAILFFLENNQTSGVCNLSAPNPAQNKDIAKIIGKQLNRPALLPTPEIMLKLLFGEMSSILLASQRMIPQNLVETGMKFSYPGVESALQDILG